MSEINQIRPWVRYFARITDYWIYGFFLGFFIPYFMIGWGDYVLGFVVILAGIPIGATFLTFLGTTPAKWLFGISVKSEKKRNLLFGEALIREIKVFIYGLGLGIPIVSLFTLINAYSTLENKKKTSWDKEEKTITIHKKIGWKVLLIITVWIIMFYLIGLSETF